MLCCNILLVLWLPNICVGVLRVYPRIRAYPVEGDPGQPLMLSPLIEAGKIEEAQLACSVEPMVSNINSYAGFLTVNRTHNSNMFFWFFPALHNGDSAPVILWLQGGPGASSLFALFTENGPFSINDDIELEVRAHSWTNSHSVLYIDNPVGTGFSFTDEGGYSTNQKEVGVNLYSALTQFFTLFPQYKNNDFFITGESYAGKFGPALAYTIHNKNPTAHLKLNLKGLAIGGGWCDPENMLLYGDFLYQIGLLDRNGREVFRREEQKCVSNIKQSKWKEAYSQFNLLLGADLSTEGSLFFNLTGYSMHLNYLQTELSGDLSGEKIGKFLSHSHVRKNLHVGNASFNGFENAKVENKLREDFMKSVKPWVEALLEHYRVLLYNGQLDMVVPLPLTEGFLDALDWSGAQDYKSAARRQWRVGRQLAGYATVAHNLAVVLVRNSGHTVPTFQPEWAEDLITRFTRNKPFF